MAEQTDIGEADDMKELALDVVEVEQTEAEIQAIQLDQQVAGIDYLIGMADSYTEYQMVISTWTWKMDEVKPG